MDELDRENVKGLGWLRKLLGRAERLAKRRVRLDTEKMGKSLVDDTVEMYIPAALPRWSEGVDKKVAQDFNWARTQRWVLEIDGKRYLAWRVWS